MTEELHALLVRLNLQMGQLHRTVQDLTRHCEPPTAGAKDGEADADFVAKAQYLALEAAIRLQEATRPRNSTARQEQPHAGQAAAPDVALGASNWRLERNGWRLVAYEHGTEIRLRPLERSLLLRLAHSPGQRLSPQELRGLDRDLAGTASDGHDGIEHAADGDSDSSIALDEADGSAIPLHAKVIARLRRRMRMRGHVLPLRMSPTAGVYVSAAVENAREGWGVPNRRPVFRHPRGADASAAAHPES